MEYQYYQKSDGSIVPGEQGLPREAVDAGIFSVADWQNYKENKLAADQRQQSQDIADKNDAFNREQFNYQKGLYEQQKADTDAQAQRQTHYDTGRASLLAQGQDEVAKAFAKFTPDYFKGYADKYMKAAADDIAYQRAPAQREMAFGLARRGAIDSQSGINQQGLLKEDEGRALAQQTQTATDLTNQLRGNVTNSKASLLGQVTNAESLGSPIAGSTPAAVGSALSNTQSLIKGVSNTSGDVVSSLSAVPTVNPMLNVFGNVLSAAGSYIGGVQANAGLNANRAGVTGTNPGGGGSSTVRAF